ncbi:ABC transporter ATP-binding protein [Aminobacter sp. AP02]|uniref:ABC transporter ATP-binding protein n=1 Tax=Aminobacter sp. AP02 TaxID=2135737 RepID=UPI000D6D02C9|nr:ABC transporter ATP-binding protein [Aminobacter sp. AP02]PWK66494.1 peptide/nickel transport system ATP-binding protein [Aminobacter sp. AP02]
MVENTSLRSEVAPILRLRDISKKYYTRDGGVFYALKEVSLDVMPGETLALVGESGSGKSTLARMALNLAKPDAGWVELAGHRTSEMSAQEMKPHRSKIQPVFQDSSATFNPRRTVRQILAQAMRSTSNPDDAEVEAKSIAILEQMSLRPAQQILKRFPHELSGGQRQRLNIARAICVNPSIIVADEPLSGADVSIRGKVLNLLRDIQEQAGVAYLFITHDIAVSHAFANRIAVMHEGKIVEYGEAREVVESPKHPYTKVLIESALLGRERLDALR